MKIRTNFHIKAPFIPNKQWFINSILYLMLNFYSETNIDAVFSYYFLKSAQSLLVGCFCFLLRHSGDELTRVMLPLVDTCSLRCRMKAERTRPMPAHLSRRRNINLTLSTKMCSSTQALNVQRISFQRYNNIKCW